MTDSIYSESAKFARSVVSKSVLEQLREPQQGRIYLLTLLLWSQLVAAWLIALLLPLWLLPLSFIIIVACIQAMLLWVHEASHVSLFRNKVKNDLWANLFFAGPVGITVEAYRERHLSHHAHLGSEMDEDRYPYFISIKGRLALLVFLLKVSTGIIGIRLAFDKYLGRRSKHKNSHIYIDFFILAFNSILLLACIYFDRWWLYLLIWVYPIFSVSILINIVRSIAEHQPEEYTAIPNGGEIVMRPVARTTVPNWLEKWIMYQANFNFHVEHHLFPQIPQHNLEKLHKHLLHSGFYDRFPDMLQTSGFKKFLNLSSNRKNKDFSDPIRDALK